MVMGEQSQSGRDPDPVLIKLVAKAYLLKTELESGNAPSIKAFAARHHMDHGDAKNLMPLAYLDPSINEEILAGRQPVEITARRLEYVSNLPFNWADQRKFLGFK